MAAPVELDCSANGAFCSGRCSSELHVCSFLLQLRSVFCGALSWFAPALLFSFSTVSAQSFEVAAKSGNDQVRSCVGLVLAKFPEAVPMLTSELNGMMIAATSGLIWPMRQKAIAVRL